MTLSTHVLDLALGEPVPGLAVRLDREVDGGWVEIAAGSTDSDGRLRDWVPAAQWHAGRYRITFDTAARSAFFPQVCILFAVADPARHHHVPLLLSPYGYTTYRGS